jgi:hypothetical protein
MNLKRFALKFLLSCVLTLRVLIAGYGESTGLRKLPN